MFFNLRKGQAEHAFAFIIFILVAAFVLILGYKGISKLMSGSCDAENLNFQQSIVGLIERYDDYGSLHKESVKIPCEQTHVCFVDASIYNSSVNPTFSHLGTVPSGTGDILESAKETRVNIFLVGEFVTPAGYSDKIAVDDGEGICMEARGRTVNLVFKGQGRKTLIEEG